MSYKPLEKKIVCNGVKPVKSEVYLLAAELQDGEGFKYFSEAIISALQSHDYYDYDYDYDDYYDYDYNYYDYDYSSQEKVIALLFLSAMYASEGQ